MIKTYKDGPYMIAERGEERVVTRFNFREGWAYNHRYIFKEFAFAFGLKGKYTYITNGFISHWFSDYEYFITGEIEL